MTRARVLVVTGDAALAGAITAALEAAGVDGRWEADSFAGLVAVERWQPAVVVLDWALPLIDGSTFVHTLRVGLAAPPPVIALVDSAAADGARTAGVAAVMVQPVAVPQLVARVTTLVEG